MHNNQIYDKLLWLHITAILICIVLFFGFITLIFFILKWCKVLSSQKVLKKSILMMGIFFASISLIMIFPSFLDICTDSYCVRNNITRIEIASETASSRRININHTLICETKDGDVYECYDYLYSIEDIKENLENNCIVYGKHSKLLLDWMYVD